MGKLKSKMRYLKFVIRRRWILIRLMLLRNGRERAEYLRKKEVFGSMGENCWYEPHKLSSEPQLVRFGNNVNVATEVSILNHDIIFNMINNMSNDERCKIYRGGYNSVAMFLSAGAR